MADVFDVVGLVVNLDRSPERLTSAARQLDAAGLKWLRVPAVDGAVSESVPAALRDLDTFRRNVGRDVSTSEIALHLSHHKAMTTLLQTDARFAVIFEDDLKLRDPAGFLPLLESLVRHSDLWDVVKLSGVHRKAVTVHQVRLDAKYTLGAPLFKTTGAAAYLINRRAAECLPRSLEPFCDHFDHVLDHPWRYPLQYRIVSPFPVAEASFPHTISYTNRVRKYSVWQRRHALFYRMNVGLQRIGYNIRNGFHLGGQMRPSQPMSYSSGASTIGS